MRGLRFDPPHPSARGSRCARRQERAGWPRVAPPPLAHQAVNRVDESFEPAPQPPDRLAARAMIHHLEPNSVGVAEEQRIVVRRVFGPQPGALDLDSERAKTPRDFIDLRLSGNAQAQMMESRSVRIMLSAAGRSNRDLQIAVEVVAMGVAGDWKGALLEAQRAHRPIVKEPRAIEIADRKVDVIHARQLRRRAPARTGAVHQAGVSSAVQCAHFVAPAGMRLRQCGHSLSAGGGGGGANLTACCTRMNIAKATITKSRIVLMNDP